MPVLTAAALPSGANLFSSPPPNPRINEPLRHPPPPPLPRRKTLPAGNPPGSPPSPSPPPRPLPNPPALRATHTRTKYFKPVPSGGGVIAADGHDRRVVVGESGVSYLLPGAPFEFRFSYSETPGVRPVAIREPAFLPFGPPTMPRPWTGKAPLKSKKEKELKRQKRVRLLNPLGGEEKAGAAAAAEGGGGKVMEMARAVPGLVQSPADGRSRQDILGKPLTRAEVKALVKPHLSHNRQVNLGRDGLTHNMLELIHTHWRRQQVCKIRCRGVPTLDMDNVCRHLEEKTGGKIIYRIGGVLYLFRGRNYDPRTRPRFPIMLWKPATPVYPKLIQEAPEGLTKAEADDLRKKGENLLPICKLAKNGIYTTLVRNVRDAFEESPLVKINCQGLHASDYKKIGAKLKELVPCVLLSFDQEQILMWRGKDWKSKYPKSTPLDPDNRFISGISTNSGIPGQSNGVDAGSTNKNEICSPRMVSLWKHAIESSKALLLDETVLSPDALLEKVEEFEGATQAAEHSYPAVISSSQVEADTLSEAEEGHNVRASESEGEDVVDVYGHYADDSSDSHGFLESSIPLGSLPVDSLAKHLNPE